jgi:hypothetical protein
MYAFLDRIDADAFEAIAAQAYIEMAKAGYASVAEFHYVHHDPGQALWRSGGARMAHRGRGKGRGIGPHVAAGVLRACRIRRHAHRRAAALRAYDVHVYAPV